VNGAKYEGYWKDDLQHGYGKEVWADGSKYDGDYYFGKKQGKGHINFTSNKKICAFKVVISGPMVLNMMVNGMIIKFPEREFIIGLMAEYMMGIG